MNLIRENPFRCDRNVDEHVYASPLFDPPGDRGSAPQRDQSIGAVRYFVGHGPDASGESDLPAIARKAVKISAMKAGKSFELIQASGRVKRFRVEFDAGMRGIETRATAGSFLGMARVRCAVGTQEKFRIARSSRLDQCQPVLFAFQDRQAIEMRANASPEDIVSIH